MKKTRLLITLLVMLVAVSSYAQDSYRQAVKEYLAATGQLENSKSLISSMSMLYEKDGQVDIDQLTKRYLDEQYEDDMIDWFMGVAKLRDMTEADLRDVASLLSSPQGKTFQAHEQEWVAEYLAEFMMPFMMIGEDEGSDEDKDWSSGGLVDLLGAPVQPKADIDPAYAAKFKNVILESSFARNMMDAMMKRMDENASGDSKKQEDRKVFTDWMTTSMSAQLLNSAYGILTPEDLDYAAMLYTNESYCKLNDNGDISAFDDMKIGHALVKYTNWMEEQGATATQDPEAAAEFYKSMLNLSDLGTDDINTED